MKQSPKQSTVFQNAAEMSLSKSHHYYESQISANLLQQIGDDKQYPELTNYETTFVDEEGNEVKMGPTNDMVTRKDKSKKNGFDLQGQKQDFSDSMHMPTTIENKQESASKKDMFDENLQQKDRQKTRLNQKYAGLSSARPGTLLKNYKKNLSSQNLQTDPKKKVGSYITNAHALNESDFYKVDYMNSGTYNKYSGGSTNGQSNAVKNLFNDSLDDIEQIISDIRGINQSNSNLEYESKIRKVVPDKVTSNLTGNMKKYKGNRNFSTFNKDNDRRSDVSKKLDDLLLAYTLDEKVTQRQTSLKTDEQNEFIDEESSSAIRPEMMSFDSKSMSKIKRMERRERRKQDKEYDSVANQIKYGDNGEFEPQKSVDLSYFKVSDDSINQVNVKEESERDVKLQGLSQNKEKQQEQEQKQGSSNLIESNQEQEEYSQGEFELSQSNGQSQVRKKEVSEEGSKSQALGVQVPDVEIKKTDSVMVPDSKEKIAMVNANANRLNYKSIPENDENLEESHPQTEKSQFKSQQISNGINQYEQSNVNVQQKVNSDEIVDQKPAFIQNSAQKESPNNKESANKPQASENSAKKEPSQKDIQDAARNIRIVSIDWEKLPVFPIEFHPSLSSLHEYPQNPKYKSVVEKAFQHNLKHYSVFNSDKSMGVIGIIEHESKSSQIVGSSQNAKKAYKLMSEQEYISLWDEFYQQNQDSTSTFSENESELLRLFDLQWYRVIVKYVFHRTLEAIQTSYDEDPEYAYKLDIAPYMRIVEDFRELSKSLLKRLQTPTEVILQNRVLYIREYFKQLAQNTGKKLHSSESKDNNCCCYIGLIPQIIDKKETTQEQEKALKRILSERELKGGILYIQNIKQEENHEDLNEMLREYTSNICALELNSNHSQGSVNIVSSQNGHKALSIAGRGIEIVFREGKQSEKPQEDFLKVIVKVNEDQKRVELKSEFKGVSNPIKQSESLAFGCIFGSLL